MHTHLQHTHTPTYTDLHTQYSKWRIEREYGKMKKRTEEKNEDLGEREGEGERG